MLLHFNDNTIKNGIVFFFKNGYKSVQKASAFVEEGNFFAYKFNLC